MTGMPSEPETDCSQRPVANIDSARSVTVTPSTGSALDSPGDFGFGHGTMVMGINNLVVPTPRLIPLKAFSNDGTRYTSDIIQPVYYAAQNNVNVINMSFDFTAPLTEFTNAINYPTKNRVICVASAGDVGAQEIVYPAGLSGVIGVASVNNSGQRSTFSNYGTQVVWVAAPGENIVTTYPHGFYASGSGTAFSAPFATGKVALILNIQQQAVPKGAAADIANANLWIPASVMDCWTCILRSGPRRTATEINRLNPRARINMQNAGEHSRPRRCFFSKWTTH